MNNLMDRRPAAAQAVRDVVMRTGQRFLVREATPRLMQKVLRRVGITVSERATGRAISRWLPIIGAVGIGGCAFYDTTQMGRTAVALFQKEIVHNQWGQPPNREVNGLNDEG